MTRDDITRMAREAGWTPYDSQDDDEVCPSFVKLEV